MLCVECFFLLVADLHDVFFQYFTMCLFPASPLFMTQLSHGLVGGEKDKFYEDLEVRTLCVLHAHNVGGQQGSEVFSTSALSSVIIFTSCPARTLAPTGTALRNSSRNFIRQCD